MKTLKPTLLGLILCSLASAACAQAPGTWVLRWQKLVTNAGADTIGFFGAFDSTYNAYLASVARASGKLDKVNINKFDPYGFPISMISVTSTGTATPRGFAVDAMGDQFLFFDQVTSTFQASTVLDGWSSSGAVLFSKTLTLPANASSLNGLTIGTDSSNNLYVATLSQGGPAGAAVQYTKYSRTGVQAFSTSAALYSNYAQMDVDGRCSAIGYDFTSGGTAGVHAVVFSPVNGSLLFHKQIANTSTVTSYFGGGNFDQTGNFYLNTITSTSSSTISVVDAYNKSFVKLWEATGIPGFAWYGAGKNSGSAFVWGSSDVYYSTGEFVANVSNGLLNWNKSTFGDKVAGLWVDEPELITLGSGSPSGAVTVINFDKNGTPTTLLQRAPQSGGYSYIGAGSYNTNWNAYIGSFSFHHTNSASADTVSGSPYGCYLYSTRQGILLNLLVAPTSAKSGAIYNAAIWSNVKPTADLTVNLNISGGTFTNGLTTEAVTIPAGSQYVLTQIHTAPSNVNKTLLLEARQGGVYRASATLETAPAVGSVAVNQTVSAAADTTDAFTVTLDGKAATGGIPVTITSSNTTVIPNGSATVVANGTTVSGSLVVHKVASTQVVNVTFKAPTGLAVVKAITVNP